MSGSPLLMFEHGGLAELGRVPELAVAEFRAHVLDAVSGGARIATFFGRPAPGGAVRLLIVLSEEYTGILSAAATTVYFSFFCQPTARVCFQKVHCLLFYRSADIPFSASMSSCILQFL